MIGRNLLSKDFIYGQVVIVFARWLLVLAGLLVALWNPGPLSELRVQIAVVLGVAVANFYLHAQLLRRRPTLNIVAQAASIGDILVITLLVASQGGFPSDLYIFYFPALLAISVAFPTEQTVVLTGLAMALYGLLGAVEASANVDILLLRLVAFAGVATVGNAYWRLHRDQLRDTQSRRLEAVQDLFFGQVALMWARWFVLGGAAMLVLLRAHTGAELAIGIAPVMVLLAINFFLHGRYVVEKPANQSLTLAASAVDLFLFAALYLTWPGGHALLDPYFVVLYPMVFAFALVFGSRLAIPFTSLAVLLYGGLCVSTGMQLGNMDDLKVLVLRLITLGATGGLGMCYWRLVRHGRREEAALESEPRYALAS